MKKVARLVEFSLRTRVIVDENATEDEIIRASYKGIQDKINNEELGDNLVECDLDEECPFGTFDDDNPIPDEELKDNEYVICGCCEKVIRLGETFQYDKNYNAYCDDLECVEEIATRGTVLESCWFG